MANCGLLPSLSNGEVSFSTTTFNSVASYTCDLGYILIGATSCTCQLDEQWSGDAPTCDGEISLYSFGHLSFMNWYIWRNKFSCLCHNNNLLSLLMISINSITPCFLFFRTAVQCLSISAPDNGGLIFTNGFIFNSLARYSCEGGYDISGASIRICRSIGSWSAIAPTCQR